MLTVVGTAARPLFPEGFSLPQRDLRIDRLGQVEMSRAVSEYERNGVACVDPELRDGREILAAGFDRSSQHRHVLTGNRQQRGTVFRSLHPGNIGTEAEAD